MIRIGLLGAGSMAAVYAERIAAVDDATVGAVASPTNAPAFVAAHAPEATAYADVDELCADDTLDAVAILTPTHLHRLGVEAAAAAGLDVICEKPLARTLEDARAIHRAVEDHGITFLTAHVVRFFPAYATARDRVAAGEVGTPGVATARRAFGHAGSRGWYDDHDASGGVLLDLAIHDFDFLRWVLGDIERVFTRHVRWERDGVSEVALSVLRSADGAVGHVESWWVEVPSVPFSTAFEIAGDEGLIEYDLDDVQPLRTFGQEAVHVPRDPVGHEIPLARDGYRRQLDHFVACVAGDVEPAVPAEEGVRSLQVALAALESATRGQPVAPAAVGR